MGCWFGRLAGYEREIWMSRNALVLTAEEGAFSCRCRQGGSTLESARAWMGCMSTETESPHGE